MSRVLETEKILAVKAYLQGEGTTHSQAMRLGVAEPTFREWVTKYKTFGESGLRASTKQMQYTAEIKNAAVISYVADTKLYIDNKIAAIAAAVLNNT